MSRALGLAVLTGLVWTAAHPPVSVWWLVFLVVPGWLTATRAVAERGARHAFLVGVVTAGTAFLPMLRWLAGPATPVAPVLLALVMGLYLGLATVALQPWVRRRWAGIAGAVLWAGFEVVRARWPLGGFGWGDLATAHVDGSWMLTSARVLGADGLTLLTALLGGLAWTAVRDSIGVWRSGDATDEQAFVPAAARMVRTFDAVRPSVLGTLAVAVLGTMITVGVPPQVGEVEVLVVQGHDGVPRTTGVAEDLRILEQHVSATRAAIEADGVPDLTVWAENSIDADPTTPAGAPLAEPLRVAAGLTEGRLLAGITRDGDEPGTFRNQVVRVREDGSLGDAYDKINIVPFGEYVPWRSVLGGLGPLDRVPRDAVRGSGPVTLDVGGVRVAPIICFETLFAPTVRAAVAEADAGLVVAVTNDASFGRGAESAQHVAQSRLRALETGRSVVHASISGTSALIGPDGRLVELAPLFEVATIRATLPVISGATPAMTVAPVLSGLLAALFVAALLWRPAAAALHRRKDPR